MSQDELTVEFYVEKYGEKHRQLITECVALVLKRNYWGQKKWNWDHYFEDLINEP